MKSSFDRGYNYCHYVIQRIAGFAITLYYHPAGTTAVVYEYHQQQQQATTRSPAQQESPAGVIQPSNIISSGLLPTRKKREERLAGHFIL
jgi:hypothetical protein